MGKIMPCHIIKWNNLEYIYGDIVKMIALWTEGYLYQNVQFEFE